MTRPISHAAEIASGDRFAFGRNWASFLSVLDEDRIAAAVKSLQEMLGVQSLAGRTFVDIGSGSGLSSLAARRLGATVHSFDYDPASVGCTMELRRRYFPGDASWTVEEGSALDQAYLDGLGRFDVVYSWGVLHHTGSMWQALANVSGLVAPRGLLFLALYNRQQVASHYWAFVKRTYNKHAFTRPLFIALHTIYPVLPSVAVRLLSNRKVPRGMSIWHDLLDWLGGYPFEVSRPAEIVKFYDERGFRTRVVKDVGRRLGCNEYVFERIA
jgi:SAM-dependent methyltransferase